MQHDLDSSARSKKDRVSMLFHRGDRGECGFDKTGAVLYLQDSFLVRK
jgi:hypothetical protein